VINYNFIMMFGILLIGMAMLAVTTEVVMAASIGARGHIPVAPRQTDNTTDAPIVDLDYSVYQGYYNPTYDLNVFKG
jgi:hypothetical protein